MKNITLLSILLFSSCDLMMVGTAEQHDAFFMKKLGLPMSTRTYTGIDMNSSAIAYYISNNVKYVKDVGDYWQNPEETMSLGTGDCEDKAILFMEIYYKLLGKKCNLILVDSNQYATRSVVLGGYINHAIVEINGIAFDPQSNNYIYNADVKYRYTFDEVFAQ